MIGIIVASLLSVNAAIQDDWTGGLGATGPVLDWGNKFWQSDSGTYNVAGQISSVSSAVNYTNWQKHSIYSDPAIQNCGIWPADLDNDGDIDLAGAPMAGVVVGTNYEQVFLNDGLGNFSLQQQINHSVHLLKLGDLNGDGWVDLVLGSCGWNSTCCMRR